MNHTGEPHNSAIKISPNETLPSDRGMIQGSWTLGIHRSTHSSPSSSLPGGSSTFKKVEGLETPRSEDPLASFASFHEALIEASKLLVCPVGLDLTFLLI